MKNRRGSSSSLVPLERDTLDRASGANFRPGEPDPLSLCTRSPTRQDQRQAFASVHPRSLRNEGRDLGKLHQPYVTSDDQIGTANVEIVAATSGEVFELPPCSVRQLGGHARTDRLADRRHHDRDALGRVFRRERGRGPSRDDEIDPGCNELRRDFRNLAASPSADLYSM